MERNKAGYILIIVGLALMIFKFLPLTFLSTLEINVSGVANGPAVDICSFGFVLGLILFIIGILYIPVVKSLLMKMSIKLPFTEYNMEIETKKDQNARTNK